MRSFFVFLMLAAAVSAPGLAATQVAQFTDGRALPILGVERAGDQTFLVLEGGGRLGCPPERIVNLADLGPPRPEPPPAPAPPATEPPMDEPWREVAGDFASTIAAAAERYGLDPALLTAVALAESNLDPSAVSHKGAQGILQLMPATAARFGVRDPFDPEQNIDGGARYLQWLLARFDGDTELALAGYNAGEGAVDRYGRRVPPYRETVHYVSRVLQHAVRLAP